MQMLMMRKGPQRADGSPRRVPIYREREAKYGRIKAERPLATKRDVLICGGHGSGKTRWVQRYVENAKDIWPTRPVAYLRAVNPVGEWCDQPALMRWHCEQVQASKLGAGETAPKPSADDILREWARLKTYDRPRRLVEWIERNGGVVIIDDGHKLTGRKADVALQAIRAARIVIMSTQGHNRLPLTIRLACDQRKPQLVNLRTEASYDVTSMLVWIMTIASLGAGAWQVAAVLGGLGMLAKGQRATVQH